MDLISREEVRRLIWRNNDNYGYSDRFHEFTEEVLNNLPSAFEGMTNGEVLKALFPNMKVHEYTEKVVLQGIGQDFQVWGDAWYAWWNSPYKGVSE